MIRKFMEISVLVYLEILFGIYIISLSVFSIPTYREIIKEDGIIENGSSFFWFLAAVTTVFTIIFSKVKTRYFLMTYIFILVFFIVSGGEEISWGQRILGFKGPSYIVEINKQHETNIHDIGSISVFANAFFLLYLLFFFVYPYKKLKDERIDDFIWQNSLPSVGHQMIIVAAVTVVIWLILGLRFGTLGFSPLTLWGYYTQMDDEIFEFLAAYSYFAFAVLDLQFKYKNDHLTIGR